MSDTFILNRNFASSRAVIFEQLIQVMGLLGRANKCPGSTINA